MPRDTLCDRPTVVLSLRRLTTTALSPDASKVLCFAGAGICDLKQLLHAHGRAAHTELGSIFLNPSVGAGVAFGSGGTQLRVRGVCVLLRGAPCMHALTATTATRGFLRWGRRTQSACSTAAFQTRARWSW